MHITLSHRVEGNVINPEEPCKHPGLRRPLPVFSHLVGYFESELMSLSNFVCFRTILLYPLSPFFVLFCNVIGEMNMDDYNIIQSILQGLSQFAASPYFSKLYKLLETLQSLSQSLLDAKERLGPQKKVTPWYPTGKKKDQPTSNDAQDSFIIGGEDFMGVPDRANPQVLDFGHAVNPSDEELMWHLFTSNISLDWFDASLATPDPNLYY